MNLIYSWGYGEVNFDAVFKWANIMHEFHEVFGQEPYDLDILDIGGALGPLDLYFTKFGNVTNIDLSFERSWFPTTATGLLIGAKGPEFNLKNLQRIQGDFRTTIVNILEPFDFIYDSCSMIHLSRSKRSNRINTLGQGSISIEEVFDLIKGNFNTDTIFVSATDIASPKSFEFKDMVFSNRILHSAIKSGFKAEVIFGENDYNLRTKPFKTKKHGAYERSLSEPQSGNNESYLMNRWPQTSVIKCVTVVGVFKFTISEFRGQKFSKITVKQKTHNFVSALVYVMINPIQMKLRTYKKH